jgi:lipopolysaccharide exporter
MTLMVGTALSQGLAVLTSPIITRLYTPAHLGAFAVFTSMATWLGVAATCRYEMAIMLPEKDRQGAELFLLSMIISFGMGVLLFIVLATSRHEVAGLFSMPHMIRWLYYLSPATIMFAFFQAASVWYSRCKIFKRISQANVSMTGVMVAVQVGAGYYYGGSEGALVSGFLLGYLAGCIVFIWKIPFPTTSFKAKAFGQDLLGLAKRYKKFPSFTLWAALMKVGSTKLPLLLLAALFDSRVAGICALALAVVNALVSFISASLTQVFFQRATEQIRLKGEAGGLIGALVKRLLLLGLIPSAILALYGPALFALIFGGQWLESGLFARIMSPLCLAMFVASPLWVTFSAMERQQLALLWQAIYFTLSILSFLIGRLLGSYILAMVLFSSLGTLHHAGMLLCIFKISRVELFGPSMKKGED